MGNASGKWYSPTAKKKDGTTLVEIQIPHIRDAHNVIGLQPEEYTPIVVVPTHAASTICGCPLCWTSIPAGFSAIVSKWGADVKGKNNHPIAEGEDAELKGEDEGNTNEEKNDGTWSPGFHCFWPWYRVSRLVTRQLIIFDTPVKDCKTQDHITVNIDVLIVFEITHANNFVYRIGPEKLDDLLRASQEETLRAWAGRVGVEQIYDLHGTNTDDFVATMNSQFENYGVKIHHFTVRNVQIPHQMAQDFEDRTLYESKTLEQKGKQESDKLNLNNEEEQTKLREEADEARMALEEEMVTAIAMITKEVRETVAMTDKDLAQMEAERNASVQECNVTTERDLAKIKSEVMMLEHETRAQMEAEVGKLEAEAEAYESNKRAAAKKMEAEKIAEGKASVAKAEGDATSAFAARRAQEQEIARYNVLAKLADNKHINIVTSVENNTGLAPNNSIVTQVSQQAMEAFRMKFAQITADSAQKLDMGKVLAGGLIRPVPQQSMD